MPRDLFAALRPRLEARAVALVGNAKSLAHQALGPEIDRCGLVIRLNAAPHAAPESHGSATHWLGASSFLSGKRIGELDPELLLWMTPEKRWLAGLAYSWRLPLLFYPEEWWRSLAARLGARPSTGLMMIDLLLRLGGFGELRLFGFDFFRSGSLSTRGLTAPPPHDFSRERRHVLELMREHGGVRLMGVSPAAADAP